MKRNEKSPVAKQLVGKRVRSAVLLNPEPYGNGYLDTEVELTLDDNSIIIIRAEPLFGVRVWLRLENGQIKELTI